MWGVHAVEAALSNPARPAPQRLVVNTERAREAANLLKRLGLSVETQQMENGDIARLLPVGAVHQGIALRAEALEPVELVAP